MNPLAALVIFVAAAVGLSKLFKKEEQATAKEIEQPRAFISFDFDNNLNEKTLFAGQCSKKSPTPFATQDWSSKDPLPQAEWESLIREKIGRCHLMFVLISPTAHKATGVAKEIEMASDQQVPLVGVYVAGANEDTPLPKGMSRRRTLPWRWADLAAAIDSALKEGKNARSR